MSATFPGGQLLRRLDAEMHQAGERSVAKILPVKKKADTTSEDDVVVRHFEDLYGFRGYLPDYKDVYYLNAWEFVMLWQVRRLPKPAARRMSETEQTKEETPPPLSIWNPETKAGEEECHWIVNPAAEEYYRDRGELLFYPYIRSNAQLRNTWYMQRRKRPAVPAPTNTPMPDRYRSAEQDRKSVV